MGNVILVPKPLLLFGTKITPRVGDDVSAQEVNEAFTGNLAFSLSGDGSREMARRNGSFVRDDSSLSLGSDPFNLAPFIFGPGAEQGHFLLGSVFHRKKIRKSKPEQFIPLSLGREACMRKMRCGVSLQQRNVLLWYR